MEPSIHSLEKEMATRSGILAWRIPWTEDPADYGPWGHRESDTTKGTKHAFTADTRKVTFLRKASQM